jgi:ribonucleoside-diphosphate reductase alpha chain
MKALQDYTFVSKYARYLPEKKRRETWSEAVERVRNMHLNRYPQITKEIDWSFEQVRQRRVLGSQRALQYGGSPIEKKHCRIYNCSATYCDRLRAFQECFWVLLCGCGVGLSVQKHHIAKLPPLSAARLSGKKLFNSIYVIPDSIEGWADSLGVLLSSYFDDEPIFEKYYNTNVKFDYSQIRPEGSLLSSGCGKAPGYKPLEIALENIRSLLEKAIAEREFRPIHAYDTIMHASDAVLSGGIRRSATIVLFSPDDMEMATAKTGNWFIENPQRGRSNNSALLIRNKTSKEDFIKLMKSVREFGEPGFVFSDSTELIVNPCCEISMYPVDIETGKSGFQFCNLCEINGKKCKTEDDFMLAAEAAAIIGTCQAGYTTMRYLGETTENILKREALLGVSITGMMDSPDILFNPETQRKVAKYILKVNEEIAAKIGINPCARATCVKPSGTTSCLLSTSSGIHAHHANRYIRRSQGNHLEPPLQYFKSINPLAVEKSVWSANKTDEVLSFCIEVPKGSKTKNDIDALTLLEHVKLTQNNWVAAGTKKERCTQDWLMHNVSNTITVRPDEWDAVTDYIYDNRSSFTGISLLPITGDKDYPQAPFTAIYTPKEIQQMYGDGSMFASGLIVDGLHVFDNDLWKACNTLLGFEELKKPELETECNYNDEEDKSVILFLHRKIFEEESKKFEAQTDWIRRAKQFADRYFGGDVKQMTYCLKDINNLHYWNALKREYKEVDYTLMIEEQNNVEFTQDIACAGGACTVSYA